MKAEYRRPPCSQTLKIGHWSISAAISSSIPRISAFGKTACASCHFAELGWRVTDERSMDRFRQADITQVATADRIGLRRQGPIRLGWPQSQSGSTGQVVDRHRLDVDARDGHARKGRGDRGAHQVRSRPMRQNSRRRCRVRPSISIRSPSALAAFERTLEPGPDAFDRWLEGDESAISEVGQARLRPLQHQGNCFVCHSGWRFTDDNSTTSARRPPIAAADASSRTTS